jgi:hypothetical protein
LTVLGEAVLSVIDATHAVVTVHLRHSAFGVRTSAAYVLAKLASCAPSMAPSFLRTALINARIQARQLIAYDGNDGSESRNAREQERLQRMFFFHGHTLALSIFFRNESKYIKNIPKQLVIETLDFGIELLQADVLNSSLAVRYAIYLYVFVDICTEYMCIYTFIFMYKYIYIYIYIYTYSHIYIYILRHIRCSIVRAGGLIVSACLSTSYDIARLRLKSIIAACLGLFKTTLAPVLSDDIMMYELMTVEAALVCVATLLWTAPEIFIQVYACSYAYIYIDICIHIYI